MNSSRITKGDFNLDTRLFHLSAIASVIGLLATVAAWALLAMIRLFTHLFFFQTVSFSAVSPASHTLGAWVIALPVIGGVAIGVLARFGTDKIRGHGIPEAIEAILFSQSKMSPKVALLKPLSSAIAIGSGGPFGAEGPIIMTGGAIGSLLAQHFHLSAVERKALLVAGAAAGMTAVFGTPLAAVLLAIEVLLFELRPRSLLPVAIACAVAGFSRSWLMDSEPIFPLQTAAPGHMALLICPLIGVVSGLMGTGLSRALYAIEDTFNRLPVHWMWWPALGGLVVGIGGYFVPQTLGVGFDVIDALLHQQLGLTVVVSIVLVKAVIWLVALGSLTSGGVLAPLMMIGAGSGALLAIVFPGPNADLYPLLCMAGLLGGAMHAPLMATAFAFGATGDASALLPLLMTTTVSYGCTVMLMPRSILTEKIARRGRHVWREIGVDPLERTFVGDCMTRDVKTIPSTMTVSCAVATCFGADQPYRAYPVINGDRLVGMVDRTQLHGQPGDVLCGQLCESVDVALPDETCRAVSTRMARLDLERIAVVSDQASMRLIGIVSRSDLVGISLVHFHEEEVRERSRRFNWRLHRP